jgi:hypothetical protein
MILLTHITIAIFSIIYTGFAFFMPSPTKLRVSYGLVAATLASGTYLAVVSHANIIQACLTGLTYLGIISVGIAAMHYRMAHDASEDQ